MSNWTWKRILLPKFYLLDELVKKIKIKNYTEDEFNISVIEKLKGI